MASMVLSPIALLCFLALLSSSNARDISASLHKNNASISSQQIGAISQQNDSTSNRVRNEKINSTILFSIEKTASVEQYVQYQTNNLGFTGVFYGLQAKLSVWSFPVGIDQHSIASLDLVNGEGDEINGIKVGWHIFPKLYGDYDPHFFVFWTADSSKNTGCFNFKCRGFILSKNATSIPGAKIWPLSRYGGTQFYVSYKVFKDGDTGDWWVYEGVNTYSNPVGYFPQSLFNNLANSASAITVGGLVCSYKNGITPPMGSGHDASEGYGKAADFEDIMFVEKSGKSQPISFINFELFNSPLKCYSGSRMKVSNGKGSFYYGGPENC